MRIWNFCQYLTPFKRLAQSTAWPFLSLPAEVKPTSSAVSVGEASSEQSPLQAAPSARAGSCLFPYSAVSPGISGPRPQNRRSFCLNPISPFLWPQQQGNPNTPIPSFTTLGNPVPTKCPQGKSPRDSWGPWGGAVWDLGSEPHRPAPSTSQSPGSRPAPPPFRAKLVKCHGWLSPHFLT